MHYPLILLGIFATAMPLSGAVAACTAKFASQSASMNVVGTNIGPGNVVTENLGVQIGNGGGDPCTVQVRLSFLSSLGAGAPKYVLSYGGQPINPSSSETTATSGSDISLNVGSGSGALLPLQLRVPTEWGLKAGSYTEALALTLLGPDGAELDQLDLTINIAIDPVASIRFVGATGSGSGSTEIDLGSISALRGARSAPFGVRVWSTAGYSVSFVSTGGGKLVHTNKVDTIPYRMSMDGIPIVLTGPSSPLTYQQHTDGLGNYHPMEIVVEKGWALAGDYSDRLTVSVTAM
jgi:hypothetical protein